MIVDCTMIRLAIVCSLVLNIHAAQQPLAIPCSPYESMNFQQSTQQSLKIAREKEERYNHWFQTNKVCCGCSRSKVANLAVSPLAVSLVCAMKDVEDSRFRLKQEQQCAATACEPSMLFLSILMLGTCVVDKFIRTKPKGLTADLDQQLGEINEVLKRKVKTD